MPINTHAIFLLLFFNQRTGIAILRYIMSLFVNLNETTKMPETIVELSLKLNKTLYNAMQEKNLNKLML
jgi:hypothetical protein